ncbi:MAG: carboxypeptidase regulatory-like domain-containing protein [Acidobacteria bacterium]|jgi:hypothetical protein|nr:carboxypeptidase regulatory-like domain-containing protein [Acidobacteriota bacterium]
MKILRILVLIFSLVIIANAQCASNIQEKSKQKMILTGAVFDKNGAVILDAKIVAYQNDGTKYESSTNTDGIYKTELPLAIYQIEISANGFCTSKIKNYRVVNSTYNKMSLDVVLGVASYPIGCENGENNKSIQKKNKKTNRKKNIEVLM